MVTEETSYHYDSWFLVIIMTYIKLETSYHYDIYKAGNPVIIYKTVILLPYDDNWLPVIIYKAVILLSLLYHIS